MSKIEVGSDQKDLLKVAIAAIFNGCTCNDPNCKTNFNCETKEQLLEKIARLAADSNHNRSMMIIGLVEAIDSTDARTYMRHCMQISGSQATLQYSAIDLVVQACLLLPYIPANPSIAFKAILDKAYNLIDTQFQVGQVIVEPNEAPAEVTLN